MNYKTFEIEPRENLIALHGKDDSSHEVAPCDNVDEVFYQLFEMAKNSLNVMWDLDGQIAPILKLMGRRKCELLARDNSTFWKPYNIFYIKEKVFTIYYAPGKVSVSFYDLKQYYPDDEPPDGIQQAHNRHRAVLDAYKVLSLTPTKLTSPIAVWKEEKLKEMDLPTSWDIPKQAAEYAWYCSGRLWIEAFKIGYWDKKSPVYDYDISGAFPTIAREMLDLRKGTWKKSNSYQPEADYGYCYGEITINHPVSPIIRADEKGNLSTPVGTWNDYITKSEIDFIGDTGIGRVKVSHGWYFFADEKVYPLREELDRILAFKKHEVSLVRDIAKLTSVGMYGMFGEEWKKGFAPHSNMVYFAEISTQARLEVARFIYENKLEPFLIHVSVDGVLLDCSLEDIAKGLIEPLIGEE